MKAAERKREKRKAEFYGGKTFFIAGEIPADIAAVKKALNKLGARLGTKLSNSTAYVVMGRTPDSEMIVRVKRLQESGVVRTVTYAFFRRVLWY